MMDIPGVSFPDIQAAFNKVARLPRTSRDDESDYWEEVKRVAIKEQIKPLDALDTVLVREALMDSRR